MLFKNISVLALKMGVASELEEVGLKQTVLAKCQNYTFDGVFFVTSRHPCLFNFT